MATAGTFKKTTGTCKHIHGFVLSAYIQVSATLTEENTFSFANINSSTIKANRNKKEECWF